MYKHQIKKNYGLFLWNLKDRRSDVPRACSELRRKRGFPYIHVHASITNTRHMSWQQGCRMQAMVPLGGVQAAVWWVCGIGWVYAGKIVP